jgi:hypothetical protein
MSAITHGKYRSHCLAQAHAHIRQKATKDRAHNLVARRSLGLAVKPPTIGLGVADLIRPGDHVGP